MTRACDRSAAAAQGNRSWPFPGRDPPIGLYGRLAVTGTEALDRTVGSPLEDTVSPMVIVHGRGVGPFMAAVEHLQAAAPAELLERLKFPVLVEVPVRVPVGQRRGTRLGSAVTHPILQAASLVRTRIASNSARAAAARCGSPTGSRADSHAAA